jgi:predicted naringenin-chalcone synthase
MSIRRPVLALPEHEVSLDEVVEHLEREYAHSSNLDRALRAVRACGVKTRRYCRPLTDLAKVSLGERVRWHFSDVCDLGEAAARQALAEAGLAPADVGTLITATSAGYRMPGLDVALVERLELSPTVRRMPVLYLGCAAAPYALSHAVEQAGRHPNKVVLVVCADMFVSFLHPDDTGLDTMIFRGLMADGAAACVVHDGAAHGPSIIDSYTCTQPGTADIVGYELDDDGFHGFNSARLLTTVEALIPRLTAWLGDPPQFVVAHPGGPRILRMLAAGLPDGPGLLEKAHQSLAEHGNMGSPSAMDILARTFDDPPPAGSRGVLIGLGPGVTMVACLTEWR